MTLATSLPERIESVEQLDDLLSDPSPALVETLSKTRGDVAVLGVGGKMGPSLARMVARALAVAGNRRRVYGVARFTRPELRAELETAGVTPVTCDLLRPDQVDGLPDADTVIAMTGLKFGTRDNASQTWATNCLVPGYICRRYGRARMVAFSTGNVYPYRSVIEGGSREDQGLAPVGEYAASAVGRERVFEYFSREMAVPVVLIRLNYAQECRYGVLVDIARRVHSVEPIDVTTGAFNVIWQGDANDFALRAIDLASVPARPLNVTGPETVGVRAVAHSLGERLGRAPVIVGSESPDALLGNASECFRQFGYPRVPLNRMLDWVADWVGRDMPLWDKPTHFETRDGRY